jgi:hypothetical protein
LTFHCWDDSLQLEDVGFTSAKLTQLERHYLHNESRDVACDLWNRQRQSEKFGSVSFTTYNHLVKGGTAVDEVAAKKSKYASIVGPCIQSVIITWMGKGQVSIDVPFRSTELFKKFAADLIFLRDVLLKPFDFRGMELSITCYVANITDFLIFCRNARWRLVD